MATTTTTPYRPFAPASQPIASHLVYHHAPIGLDAGALIIHAARVERAGLDVSDYLALTPGRKG